MKNFDIKQNVTAEPVAGKYLLEILTRGMYSNPLHIYREYIQNAADSIDRAIDEEIINKDEAYIHIVIDKKKKVVTITDNGIGLPFLTAKKVLMSIGDSNKDGIVERGFRGIGRLGGLAYADEVKFITTSIGDNKAFIVSCDCVKLRDLLQKSNHETQDVMETFLAISSFDEREANPDDHYFTVIMRGVAEESVLLDESQVHNYLAQNAPVDFDDQLLFSLAGKIRDFFKSQGFPLVSYNLYQEKRKVPIYKLYSRTLSTGQQKRTKAKDHIRNIEFIYEKDDFGKPLYIGWLAITDFSGIISDENVQGIRLRKGNIQVGDNNTFARFFPSEGNTANRMFAGEIHVLHDEILPNSQRDDFEPGIAYECLKTKLTNWAYLINKKYRRGTSEATSALKRLQKANQEQRELESQIQAGSITSDIKRQKVSDDLEKITKKRDEAKKVVLRALDKGTFDSDRKQTIEKALKQTERDEKNAIKLRTLITDADYATKNDLPSSYSRAERNLYQRMIAVIDLYFKDKPEVASELHERIKQELSVKKK